MKHDFIEINGFKIPVVSLNTVIVGTGCAGYNAADSLHALGQHDIAIVTEGINMGTSRNTGSDKQTYYKLALEANIKDSIYDMAQTLFSGGSMHGDIALVEAALSAKSFYKLVEAGVPFPHNEYGEYVGYKTDHDPSKRATSVGPLTSKRMTERLQESVEKKNIRIFDGFRVIGILTKGAGEGKSATGLVAINMNSLEEESHGLTLFNCTNIIYATGGPAGMYKTSVYPESQTGASGIAFYAGAKGINLTESQYGIASTKFRWNLSGTYQQVIPRYVSTDKDGGDEREFLDEYFEDTGTMLDAIFLKGYQWPFDPRKIENYGSSLIDILVYNETQIKGRRVFMDFIRNPTAAIKDGAFDFSLLGEESRTYLKKSNALLKTPIERLAHMNTPAVELYKNNGIDISKEYLEIAVCAQHNNGGLMGNIWWESNLQHFFPVGEVNGTFGVYRPGGSALNSTQVGSYRAAQYISKNYTSDAPDTKTFLESAKTQINEVIDKAQNVVSSLSKSSNVFDERDEIQLNMTRNGAHIRSLKSCEAGIAFCKRKLKRLFYETKVKSLREYPEVFINYDMLLTQYVYLSAIKEYIECGGKSRGSYLVNDENGSLPAQDIAEVFKYSLDDGALSAKVLVSDFDKDTFKSSVVVCDARPIPKTDNWFETVWNDFMQKKIVR